MKKKPKNNEYVNLNETLAYIQSYISEIQCMENSGDKGIAQLYCVMDYLLNNAIRKEINDG